MTTPTRRDTARIVLLDPENRVLLFRYQLPAPWSAQGWLTPGGAMEPGESPADAVVREIKEEIGLTLTPVEVGRPIAFDSGQWEHGGTTFASVNWYFFARAATPHVDLSGQEDSERRGLIEHRWWDITTLPATRDIIRPVGLGDLLRTLIAGDLPQEPVQLPWN